MPQIIDYKTQYTDIEFIKRHLSQHNESQAWLCGVLDFASGELARRRFRPDLDSELIGDEFQIFGPLTYKIKDQIKEYGGKWNPSTKRWILWPTDQALREDCLASIDAKLEELGYELSEVYYPEFKEGIPWDCWINDYNQGKLWAEANGEFIRKDNTFHRHKNKRP